LALCSAREREHSDVVVLAEQLRCFSNLVGRLDAYRRSAFEAEQRAGLVAGLGNAVRNEGEPLAMVKLKGGLGIRGFSVEAEGSPFSSSSSLPPR